MEAITMSDQIVQMCCDGETVTINRVGKFGLSTALIVEEGCKKGKHQRRNILSLFAAASIMFDGLWRRRRLAPHEGYRRT
jgi:hypothetical protein